MIARRRRALFDHEHWQDWYADKQRGRCINSGVLDGLAYKAAVDAVADTAGSARPGREEDHLAPARLGHQPPALLGHADPDHPLRRACGVVPVPEKDLPVLLPEDLVPDGCGNPLHKNASVPERRLPAVRQAGAARDRHDGHLRRLAPGTSCAIATRRDRRRWSVRGTTTGCRWTSTSAASSTPILHLLYARFWTKVMRDMGLVKFDEPFTRLLTQGMVLNEAFVPAKTAQGGNEYLLPDEVDVVGATNVARPIGATARARRPAGRCYGGMRRRWQVQEQRRRPAGADRQVRRRHRAPVRHVRRAARADAGMEQRRRRGREPLPRRLWKFGAKHAAVVRAAARRRQRCRQCRQGAAPRDARVLLKQVSYDYERMQYNTVVSGAMKLLNALEGSQRRRRGADAALREGFGILLRALYPVCPHITWALWGELGYAASSATCSTRPGRRSTSARWCRTRSSWCCRSTASCAARSACRPTADKARIEAAALAAPEFAKFADGKPAKKVIVVPGRLVNVVV